MRLQDINLDKNLVQFTNGQEVVNHVEELLINLAS